MNNEILAKARAAKTPEELLQLARENNIADFTEENAKAYFEAMHRSGELADEELDVSAGGCKNGGKTVVTHLNSCGHFLCRDCGRDTVTIYDKGPLYKTVTAHGASLSANLSCYNNPYCCNCKYFIYERGLWLCNNPEHNAE